MKAIYKYTILKYFKSYSTWVIMAFSAIVIGFIIGGMLPFLFIDVTKQTAAQTYSKAIVLTVAGITVFFGIFSAIFAGFKSATMYKDEVENGTFLVLISKPMKRIDILFGKWLALQTLLLMYATVSVLFLCFGVMIFDNGSQIPELNAIGFKSLKTSIWYAGIFMFLILYLTALIFSSLGIMISTKLSTGTTIGIIIAIGVYIPISGLIGMFARKPEAYPISVQESSLQTVEKIIQARLESNPLIEEMYPNLKQKTSDFMNNQDVTNLYNKALSADQKDSYHNLYWLDFDYQFKLLSSYAYESLIPQEYIETIRGQTGSLQNAMSTPQSISKLNVVNAKNYFTGVQKFVDGFNEISDDLVQLFAQKMFLELQPININDLVNFILTPEAQGLVKPGQEMTLIDNLKNSNIKDNFSIEKLQQLLKDNENSFTDISKTIKVFLQWAITSSNRDETDFLIKDNYKFKVSKSKLTDIEHLIWEAYDYYEDGSKYQVNSNYPQAMFDDLKKHYSAEVVNFLQDYHKEYFDSNYAVWSDDGKTESDDFRYVDFKIWKEENILLYIKDTDASGKVKFPIRNINSTDILNEHFDSNNKKIIDEQFVHAKLYASNYWRALTTELKKDGDSTVIPIVNSAQGSIAAFTLPITTFILKGGIANNSFPDVDVQNRHLSEMRKLIDPGYDSVKKYNTLKYSDISEDPISNLSATETDSLEFALSAMLNHQGVTYESKPYANRDVVLGIYTAIALGLLPLTYWVVRRQDFR